MLFLKRPRTRQRKLLRKTLNNQYLGGDTSLACSAQTQARIDKKVVELVRTQHQKALRILEDNKPKMHELAEYLYFRETITGEEFMTILNCRPIPKEIPMNGSVSREEADYVSDTPEKPVAEEAEEAPAEAQEKPAAGEPEGERADKA